MCWSLSDEDRRRYCNEDERRWTRRYGAKLDEIACMVTAPRTEKQRHFLEVREGHAEPRDERERLWQRVQIICRFPSVAERSARTDNRRASQRCARGGNLVTTALLTVRKPASAFAGIDTVAAWFAVLLGLSGLVAVPIGLIELTALAVRVVVFGAIALLAGFAAFRAMPHRLVGR